MPAACRSFSVSHVPLVSGVSATRSGRRRAWDLDAQQDQGLARNAEPVRCAGGDQHGIADDQRLGRAALDGVAVQHARIDLMRIDHVPAGNQRPGPLNDGKIFGLGDVDGWPAGRLPDFQRRRPRPVLQQGLPHKGLAGLHGREHGADLRLDVLGAGEARMIRRVLGVGGGGGHQAGGKRYSQFGGSLFHAIDTLMKLVPRLLHDIRKTLKSGEVLRPGLLKMGSGIALA